MSIHFFPLTETGTSCSNRSGTAGASYEEVEGAEAWDAGHNDEGGKSCPLKKHTGFAEEEAAEEQGAAPEDEGRECPFLVDECSRVCFHMAENDDSSCSGGIGLENGFKNDGGCVFPLDEDDGWSTMSLLFVGGGGGGGVKGWVGAEEAVGGDGAIGHLANEKAGVGAGGDGHEVSFGGEERWISITPFLPALALEEKEGISRAATAQRRHTHFDRSIRFICWKQELHHDTWPHPRSILGSAS
mmetsp:Transcript_13319/g.21841  ORF Transcript_13319/g.21841 Transcript_13319/m.21841 type:complete len:243 (+) Transcript_13319:663-1391(+)